MAKVRTTLTIEEDVLRTVKVAALAPGKGDSEVDRGGASTTAVMRVLRGWGRRGRRTALVR
jgi:hypothetical protein